MATASRFEHYPTVPLPRQIYAKPPVVEALVDIHVALPDDFSVSTLEAVRQGEESNYPVVQRVEAIELTIDAGSGDKTKREATHLGYRFVSGDQQQIVQVRRNGFTFSRLPPYTKWEDWRPEAQRLWRKFVRVAEPREIRRYAVRYVNRINIPAVGRPIRDYLQFYPELGPDLPQGVNGFLMRVEIPQEDLGATLVLSMGREFNPSPNHISIVLDLDLSNEFVLPVAGDAVWDMVEQLHERENRIFEGCITPLTRTLFQ